MFAAGKEIFYGAQALKKGLFYGFIKVISYGLCTAASHVIGENRFSGKSFTCHAGGLEPVHRLFLKWVQLARSLLIGSTLEPAAEVRHFMIWFPIYTWQYTISKVQQQAFRQ